VSNETVAYDVSILKKGDVVHYTAHEGGKFFIEKGTLTEDNLYSDGVEVHGEGWKQYVSKWFICKVERNDNVIYESEDYLKLNN
jgi:hypothetical protein